MRTAFPACCLLWSACSGGAPLAEGFGKSLPELVVAGLQVADAFGGGL